eukprot:1279021-Pyramimonas_sp.AAC.1
MAHRWTVVDDCKKDYFEPLVKTLPLGTWDRCSRFRDIRVRDFIYTRPLCAARCRAVDRAWPSKKDVALTLAKENIYGAILDIVRNGPCVSVQIPSRGRGPFWANIWYAEKKNTEHRVLFRSSTACRAVRHIQ